VVVDTVLSAVVQYICTSEKKSQGPSHSFISYLLPLFQDSSMPGPTVIPTSRSTNSSNDQQDRPQPPSIWTQVHVLLWRSYALRKRNLIRTIVSIAAPAFLPIYIWLVAKSADGSSSSSSSSSFYDTLTVSISFASVKQIRPWHGIPILRMSFLSCNTTYLR
jgi:hypothetical protein